MSSMTRHPNVTEVNGPNDNRRSLEFLPFDLRAFEGRSFNRLYRLIFENVHFNPYIYVHDRPFSTSTAQIGPIP